MTKYLIIKPKLVELIIQRKTLKEISEALSISMKTAERWRKRYIEEVGQINEELAKQIMREFIAKNRADIEQSERVLFTLILDGDVKAQLDAINALLNVKKFEIDLYERLGVFSNKSNNKSEVPSFSMEELREYYLKNQSNQNESQVLKG